MTSSLHGDEVDEVRVIHRLFQMELDPESLHGIVVVVARISGTRGMDGQDLNKLMPWYSHFRSCINDSEKRWFCTSILCI
jgi:predicted deacylase